MPEITCSVCGFEYPPLGAPYRCLKCGGVYDYSGPFPFNSQKVQANLPGIWGYQHAFQLPEEAQAITLGEGNTPLIRGEAFGASVLFKCEYQNPTGSFKDRGTATLTSFLEARKITQAVEDSSGNAGSSFAAYAARAGIQAKIFVPDSASGPKRTQIEAYGAEVVQVMGPRVNSAEAVQRTVEPVSVMRKTAAESLESEAGYEQKPVYASHAHMPFLLPGYATLAYELYAELGTAPGTVIIPVGQGGLLLGVGRGFEALQVSGLTTSIPRLIGVQARACAPLWAVSAYGSAGLTWTTGGETVAEGIRITHPIRGDAILQIVKSSQGTFLAVDEEEILPGVRALARRGFYVEPTSAVVWGALSQIIGRVPEPLVVVLTGSGLKSNLIEG
jgi:threonine synthase